MKKLFFTLFIVLLVFSLFSYGKSNSIMNYDSSEYVNLYDYSSISTTYKYTQISNEDIKNIIETELSINEAYIEITNKTKPNIGDIVLIAIDDYFEYYFIGSGTHNTQLDNNLIKMNIGDSTKIEIWDSTLSVVELKGIYRLATIKDINFILEYYNCSSSKELDAFIKARASDEIIFNYAYDIICEKSEIIKTPHEIQLKIDSDIKDYYKEISEYYSTIEDFFKEQNITKEDFENSIVANYYEMMLYKAIMDNENISITKKDIHNYRLEHRTTEYSDYDIYRELAYSYTREILIKKTQIINE